MSTKGVPNVSAQPILAPVEFDRLHPAAILPTGGVGIPTFTLYVCDLTETGRENRITLPPHSISRPIPTGLAIKKQRLLSFRLYTPPSLLRSGIFVVSGEGVGGGDQVSEIKLYLFNTSHEARRIMHGDEVAELEYWPLFTRGPASWSTSNGDD